MINLQRLHEELQSLPIVGCSLGAMAKPITEVFTRYVRIDGVVGVDWQQPPTEIQKIMAADLISTHNGTPTTTEKLDKLLLPSCLLAALAFRLSDSWTPSTVAQRVEAQQIIDAAGAKALQVIP